jgi:hypothetical protein
VPQFDGAVQPAALYPGKATGDPSPLAPPAQPEPLPIEPQPLPRPVPPPQSPPVVLAFLSLVEKHPEDAVLQLARYDRPTQDMLLALLPALARLSEGNLDKANPQELANLLAQIDSARAALVQRVPLILERLCYCRDLDHARFGFYQALPGDHPFRPNEFVEIYGEVRNFTSQRSQDGQHYEIHLKADLEIRDGAGQRRWHLPVPDSGGERSQSPRHDHFVGYRFYIPDTLRGGHYTLHVRVTDIPSGRSVERALDLHVCTRPVGGP